MEPCPLPYVLSRMAVSNAGAVVNSQRLAGRAEDLAARPISAMSLHVPPKHFLEALPIAIYACAADGRILWFNERACRLWGRTPRVGDPHELYCGAYTVFAGERRVLPEETPMAEVLRTGNPIRSAEARVQRPDGSEVWAEIHIEPVRDEAGAVIGAINCFHETNGPPREHMRWLAEAYDNARIGIAEVERDGKLRRLNAHLRDILQAAPEGKAVFNLIHDDDRGAVISLFEQQLAGHLDHYELEIRLSHENGEHRWVSVSSRGVKDTQGTHQCALWIVRDITLRKASEQRLESFSKSQTALHTLTATLQRAGAPDGVYSAAIEAIHRSLQCSRASVLLLDAQGVMRFEMARGLSRTYMEAVEGHSPWDAGTADARPICIDDVVASGLADDLKGAVLQEGIRALAFIPIESHDRLLGKFMVYYDEPHSFSRAEIDTARTIARHVSFSLERLHSQRSAQHLATIVETSWDAIVSKDTNATITSWNAGAERLFGYTVAEAVGKPITMVIPSDRLDEEPNILARIRRGERVDPFETVRKRRDGTLIDVSLTISPIRDSAGCIVGASKIARDISGQKAAERSLRESEQRLHDLLSAIPAAIYTTDADGRLTYFNDAAVEFSGRRPALGVDRFCVSWKLFKSSGEPLPHDECPMALALKEGRPVRGVEAVAERPDGTRVPFIPYPTPLRDSSGKIVGAINMLVDISQRKDAETQQRLLLHELNHRVKNNMQMLQALLARSARRASSPEARLSLEEASARVAALASAQRVLYGQSGGQLFASDRLVKEVCDAALQTFPSGVILTHEAVSIALNNDIAMPLALILNELLTNAVKHGARGPKGAKVRVSLQQSEGDLVLSVEDDGPGFNLESARKSSSGIQLIEGIARQVAGNLTVIRRPRTRVTLRFPVKT